MKLLAIRYRKLTALLLVVLTMGAGFAVPITASAANNDNGNGDTSTALGNDGSIPVGCPGNPSSGPRGQNVTCPKLADSKSDLNCTSNQTPTKLISGPKSGQWFCKGASSPSGSASGGGNDQTQTQPNGNFSTGDGQHKTINDVCGDGDDAVGLSIKVGCKGKGNPITDMVFAIIRILSDGVGLVVIASIIVGGIQYTGSRGDPQSTAMAVNRIRSSVFALIIFIFGYAILNFIIPAGFLQ